MRIIIEKPHQFLDTNNLGNSPQQFQFYPFANPLSIVYMIHAMYGAMPWVIK
jgi:hypothetical protein